jgi:transcriptional regulator with XRE-family HTH domain
MKSNKQSRLRAILKAKTSPQWGDRGDYRKDNRAWLRKSSEIALRILDALDKMQISQAELANRLNVSRQHISKIIKGQENLTLETIARIEGVLKIVLIVIPEETQDLNLGDRNGNKIKPIIYHTFAEKEQLEKKLFAKMPEEKRRAVAASLMSMFHKPTKKKLVRKSSIKE